MSRKVTIIYLILISILSVLAIAVAIFPRKNQVENQKQVRPTVPMPTAVINVPSPSPSFPVPSIAPTETGGNEDIPTAMSDLSAQKQDLRRKTPVKMAAFTIEFNYAEDNFTVTLNEPKTTSQQTFDAWLKQNYPLLPLSQFVLQ